MSIVLKQLENSNKEILLCFDLGKYYINFVRHKDCETLISDIDSHEIAKKMFLDFA